MSWIERMRQKSNREKKMVAFIIALIVTFVIAVLWIVAKIAMQNQ